MKKSYKSANYVNSEYLGVLEVEDNEFHVVLGDRVNYIKQKGWRQGEVVEKRTGKKVICFGICIGAEFIESGHITPEDYESVDETLQELHEQLTIYYTRGSSFARRLHCNDLM